MVFFSTVLYTLAGLVLLVVGTFYLTAKNILPVHKRMLGKRWRDLEPQEQFTLTTFERGLGAGLFSAGALIQYLTHSPLSEMGVWAAGAATAAGLFMNVPATYFGIMGNRRYKAGIPWPASATVGATVLIAFVVQALSG